MKNFYSAIGLLFLITVSGCKKDEPGLKLQSCNYSGSVVDFQTSKKGRVYQVADFWLIDLMINGKVIRCAPCNLPDELKIENKSIVIDAEFHPIPPNVKLAGQPIEVTKIY